LELAPVLMDGAWSRLGAAIDEHRDSFLARPGVVGVGLGRRRIRGTVTEEPALIVYVREKKAEAGIPPDQRVGPMVRYGRWRRPLRTDVVELGLLQPHAAGGDSLGLATEANMGTIGAFALDSGTLRPVGLTAMHVSTRSACPPDMASFVSPSLQTGNSQVFGELEKGTRARTDAARVRLDAGVVPSFRIRGIGPVNGWRRLSMQKDRDRPVRVFGAVSGLLVGVIREPFAILADDEMNLDPGILVEIDTTFGDSGAGMVDENNRLLGLLVGIPLAYPELRAFTPMALVASTLGITIPPGEFVV
jgi:hypothetical protein